MDFLHYIACWFGWHKDSEEVLEDGFSRVRLLRTCRHCTRSAIVVSSPFEGRY